MFSLDLPRQASSCTYRDGRKYRRKRIARRVDYSQDTRRIDARRARRQAYESSRFHHLQRRIMMRDALRPSTVRVGTRGSVSSRRVFSCHAGVRSPRALWARVRRAVVTFARATGHVGAAAVARASASCARVRSSCARAHSSGPSALVSCAGWGRHARGLVPRVPRHGVVGRPASSRSPGAHFTTRVARTVQLHARRGALLVAARNTWGHAFRGRSPGSRSCTVWLHSCAVCLHSSYSDEVPVRRGCRFWCRAAFKAERIFARLVPARDASAAHVP